MKLKVAIISDAAYPWHVGGLEAVEQAEAAELAKNRRYRIEFFCMRWPGMPRGDFRKDGITYRPMIGTDIHRFYRHGRRSIRTSVLFTASMFRLFTHRFDFIYANMFPILHVPILKLYCKLTGCLLVLDVVEVWEKRYWTEYLGALVGNFAYAYSSYFLDSANAYITNSSITARGLVREGIGEHMLNTFAPILDDKVLDRIKAKAHRKPRAIYYGRLIKEKRVDRWLVAFKAAHRMTPRLRGLIIGDGPEAGRLAAMIKEMGLSDSVEMRPFYKSTSDLFKEIADSSMMLLMSEREGLSISTLQALALGVPVVLPAYSPIPPEVKEMCVVANEKDIPARIADIMASCKPESFIRNREKLTNYTVSAVRPFFARLFRRTASAYRRDDLMKRMA